MDQNLLDFINGKKPPERPGAWKVLWDEVQRAWDTPAHVYAPPTKAELEAAMLAYEAQTETVDQFGERLGEAIQNDIDDF